jgi:hypothetical protein
MGLSEGLPVFYLLVVRWLPSCNGVWWGYKYYSLMMPLKQRVLIANDFFNYFWLKKILIREKKQIK